MSKRIAILASGSGTNAENLIEYFKSRDTADIVVICTNNPNAGVLARAKNHNVPAIVFSREELRSGNLTEKLRDLDIDVVVLAGFLWLVPSELIRAFPDRVINIHPSLLPKYGGKGMYGSKVHEAVIANQERESGITIHLVNEEYDKGDILFQAATEVTTTDTPDTLAQKIHQLEYKYFPEAVEKLLSA